MHCGSLLILARPCLTWHLAVQQKGPVNSQKPVRAKLYSIEKLKYKLHLLSRSHRYTQSCSKSSQSNDFKLHMHYQQ